MTAIRRRPGDGTGGLRTGTATFDSLREKAVALRREGLSRREIRDRPAVHNNDILNRLLEGEPPPERTKRPNAEDDLRDRARELRLQGMTYDRIQVELDYSKSSISLWVRALPKPTGRRTPAEQARPASRRRWEHENTVRDEQRSRAKESAARSPGRPSRSTTPRPPGRTSARTTGAAPSFASAEARTSTVASKAPGAA